MMKMQPFSKARHWLILLAVALIPILAVRLPLPRAVFDYLSNTVSVNHNGILQAMTRENAFPGAAWEFKTPAEVGLDPAKLDEFAGNVGGVGVIVKDGYIVKAWGNQTAKSDWASASKPVISTLLFFAMQEGKVPSVDAPVKDWGWELIPKDQGLTFRHLANMTSGYALPEAPGTAWGYNDYGTMLYAKTLAERVFDEGSMNAAALQAQRLGALQFEDGSLFSARKGFGISTTARDFARIGWFWLNKGNWNGEQLLPNSFFDSYMTPDVPIDLPRTAGGTNDYLSIGSFGGGTNQTSHGPGIYGFGWWFNDVVPDSGNLAWPDAPADTIQANGHWGKEVLTIIPSLGMVVAARGNWGSFDPGNASAGMNQNLKLLKEAVQTSPPPTDPPPTNPPTSPGNPLAGQIVVDPNNPAWFKYHGGGPYFLAGPGDPEDFLYRGTRNQDGTRSGDQMELIDKLKGTGANSIYLMAIRSHGGDGDATHNPFVNNDPKQGLNDAVLDQWETWFSEMDQHGITIFFFFYDDSARIWNTGDAVGDEERGFVHALVARFKHHKHLIWVVAEEYGERYSAARVSNIAAEIRAADDHHHAIAVHKNHGLSFSEFAADPNIDQFAIQYNVSSAARLHEGVVTAWNEAGGRYNLNLAEANRYGTGQVARQKSWAIAMGGAYVMVYQMDIASTAVSDLEDLGRLRRFFESTNFNEMAPRDDLAFAGTDYVLALPGDSYIAYAFDLTDNMGLRGMSGGSYNFRWYDPMTGVTVTQDNVTVAAGDQSWPKPSGLSNEVAVYIYRSDKDIPATSVPTSTPTFAPTSVPTPILTATIQAILPLIHSP
jgi:CubicO group peptidase (beta-lactamase class C family)